jgi:hypothetical protein
MNNKRLVFFITCQIFILSCNQQDKSLNPSSTYNGPELKEISFKLNPGLNNPYAYNISSTTEIEQVVNEEKIKSNNVLHITEEYLFTNDSAGNIIANSKFKEFKLSIKTQDIEKELDASKALNSSDPSEKMFNAFNGAAISLILDTLGNVKSVIGTKELTDKMYKLAGGDANALQMLNTSIKQYAGDDFFKQIAEQNFKLFTGRILKIGDTVMQITPINAGLVFNCSTFYKLISLKNGIGEIEISSDINIEEQQMKVENTNVTATIKGKQKGEMQIDVVTGLIIKSSSELKLKGMLEIMGREVPIKFLLSNRVERK